jgi:hypothetical protein
MGDAATPTLPNFTNQTASVYKANIDAGFAVADRLAWAFAPHQQDQGSPAPDMTVRVDAGALLSGVTLIEVAAQSTGTIAAPSVDPRIDRVVIDAATGAVSVATGTEAASPSPPAIPTGKLPVARVALSVGQTEIVNSDITDERTPAASSGGFPSGTLMLFQQTAAPTGWTKQTTHNDKSLRVVSGTAGSGGATAFTSVFGSGKSSGSYTLVEADIPGHTHNVLRASGGGSSQTGIQLTLSASGFVGQANAAQSTGGDGAHQHTLSLDLQYVDLIIASKD